MDSSQQPTSIMAAIDDLLLRASIALPSSDPQDMHTYATKGPSQIFLKEVLDVTHSISNALVTMVPAFESKALSLLKEHTIHDQVVFEREDLSRRASKLLPGRIGPWIEDIPLDVKSRPDFVLSRVERWAKEAKMEVYQSDENGQNTLTCAGSAVVLDFVFEKNSTDASGPIVHLVSLKSSYPTSSESAPVTQPLNPVEEMIGSDIKTYISEIFSSDPDAQKAAQLARRVVEHIQYIMLLDAQAALEAATGDTGARWFAEVGILSPQLIDLACQEAAGLASHLGTNKAPLDIFLRRGHALPLINLNSPSISFLIGMTTISYLSLLKISSSENSPPTPGSQPLLDISNSLLRRFVIQHPTPPGITTCNLIIAPSNQSGGEGAQQPIPRTPLFPLLGASSMPAQSHLFPFPRGNYAWVLDFGERGLVMRRSAMQALVQALGHEGDIDVALSGMGFMTLGMGLMSEENMSWVNMLLHRPVGTHTQQIYTTETSPKNLFPPIHLTLRVPSEAGFILGRIRVRNMTEVWTILEIIREQCWLNSNISLYDWTDSPIQPGDTTETQGLSSLLSGRFLSIPTQMTISTTSGPPSLLLQFPIPTSSSVPTVVQFMVSYDPTASRGTRTQFGSLDPKLSATEILGRYESQVDEVIRRAGPLGAVGWIHAHLPLR